MTTKHAFSAAFACVLATIQTSNLCATPVMSTAVSASAQLIDVRYRRHVGQPSLYVRFREPTPYASRAYWYWDYPYSYSPYSDYIPGFRYGGF
jgi:hypothetical protein